MIFEGIGEYMCKLGLGPRIALQLKEGKKGRNGLINGHGEEGGGGPTGLTT